MGKSPRSVDTRTRLLNTLGLFKEETPRRLSYNRPPMLFPRSDVNSADSDGGPSCNSSTSTIQPQQQQQQQQRPSKQHVRRWSDMPTASALRNSVMFETPLKDHEAIAKKTSFFHNTPHHRKSTSIVRFHTVVECVQIPSRSQYSKRIKQTLWRDREELSEMVERNTEEFRAEKYDWKNVVLDDDMYLDANNGELVHPCHVGVMYDYDDDIDDAEDSDSTDGEGDKHGQGNVQAVSEDEDDSFFVPLGQKGKSRWEVLQTSP